MIRCTDAMIRCADAMICCTDAMICRTDAMIRYSDAMIRCTDAMIRCTVAETLRKIVKSLMSSSMPVGPILENTRGDEIRAADYSAAWSSTVRSFSASTRTPGSLMMFR
jgi:hypothetical protein